MDKQEWYAAKCIFQHDGLSSEEGQTVYEERVILLRADSFEEAIALGEAEAQDYAQKVGDARYCDFITVFHLFPSSVGHGTEVYSLMRRSPLAPDDFINHYHDDGTERTNELEGTDDR